MLDYLQTAEVFMWYNRRWKGGSQNAFTVFVISPKSILVKTRGESGGIQVVLPVCYFYKIHHNSKKFKGHWGGPMLSELLFCLHFSSFFYVIFLTWLTSPYIFTWSFIFQALSKGLLLVWKMIRIHAYTSKQ